MSTLAQRVVDLSTRLATECKSHKMLINGNAADLSALTTTAKTNLVAALNEVRTAALASEILDTSTTTDTAHTWSANKINSSINSAINAVLSGAPTALDTLNELAAALGNDANYAATTTAALGNRVRYDAVQTLTTGQVTQACANIGVGEPNTDFVSTFNAGLI